MTGRMHTLLCLVLVCAVGCARRSAPEPANDTPPARAPSPEIQSESGAADPAETSARDEPAAESPPESPAEGPREVFPGVRVDRDARTVAFDGYVPLDAHDPETPIVYLELVACTPDTREHESLVATTAKPSHIHAAMLLVGLKPGSPGRFRFDEEARDYVTVPPEGDCVSVTLTYEDASGSRISAPAADWVIDQRTGETLAPRDGADAATAWIFAGSKLVEFPGGEVYDADGSGTLIGLTTFSSETIAWTDVYSHQAAVQEPNWIVNRALVPAQGTPVEVTIGAVERR